MIDRRHFLKSLGIGLALPALESVQPVRDVRHVSLDDDVVRLPGRVPAPERIRVRRVGDVD